MVTGFRSVPSRRTDAICSSSALPTLSSWSLVHCVIGLSPSFPASPDIVNVIVGTIAHRAQEGRFGVHRRFHGVVVAAGLLALAPLASLPAAASLLPPPPPR